MTTLPSLNPYIGPRTFTREDHDRFFGREQEARELLSRVVSQRLVLFYAQSGAGKSSLVNTRLIPQLEKAGFTVLPVGRVGGEASIGIGPVDNIFLFNLMLRLDASNQNPARLAHLPLADFLAGLTSDDGKRWYYDSALMEEAKGREEEQRKRETTAAAEMKSGTMERGQFVAPNYVLIIDQFEEIITTNVDRWTERKDFFSALETSMLADPKLWVVLVLREDYVAALDPYAALMTDKLRARYYMQCMDVDAALAAIQEPAKAYGRPFAPDIAEKLVDDLRRIKVLGQTTAQLGQYVEPVQLQVVCYQLWENLAKQRPLVAGAAGYDYITAADLAAAGDVDTALARFYEETVANVLAAAETPVSERQLRTWFDNQLITPTGTRGLVLRGTGETGGLPNAVVRQLQARFLVRSENRAGGAWVELVHDRFVEPIRQANQVWFEVHLSQFQRQAALWEQRGRPNGLLLSGDTLAEAEQWADAHTVELTPYERDFLTVTRQVRVDFAEHLAWTAQILLPQQRDLALLLSAEASCEAVTSSTRNSLLRSLQDDVHLGSLPLPQISPGHSASVNITAVSPDGKIFATGGLDMKILLWDLVERKPIGEPLLGHSKSIMILAFSPDGRILASAGHDQSIRLWDVATHQPAGPTLYGHYQPVWGLAYSPDGRLLASSDDGGNIVIWDLWAWLPSEDHAAPTPLSSRRTVRYLKGHQQAVWWLEFRPQGDLLASASIDGTIGLWSVRTGRQVAKLTGHPGGVLCVAFSQDGKRLVSSDAVGSVFVWDVAKRQQILKWQGHSALIPAVRFSPDGSLLASGGWDKHVIVWEAATGRQVHPPLSGHEERISSLTFTPNGQELVSVDLGGTVFMWNVATGVKSPPLKENKVSANSVAITPDGSTLIGGCSDGSLVLWGLPAFQIREAPLRGHRRPVSWVRVSPDGKYMVSAGWEGDLVIWQTAERQPLRTLRGHKSRVFGAAFSPDGRTLASAGDDGRILIWNCADWKLLKEILVETGAALMVAYQPTGNLLASAHADGMVRLWDPASGQLKIELAGDCDVVYSLAWHPTGRLLASGDRGGRVWLWDAETNYALREPLFMEHAHNALSEAGHSEESITHMNSIRTEQWGSNQAISSLAFSPNGEILASGAVSGAVTLWDVERWSLLGLPLWSGSPIALDMAFTPDGNQLITAHGDGKIHRWATGDITWRQLACYLAGRELTVEERQKYLR